MCLGIPGEVTALFRKDGLRFAKVRFGGVSREVCLEYQPDTALGDFVLVHVGFAISKLDAQEAARSLEVLQELGQLEELQDGALGDEEPSA